MQIFSNDDCLINMAVFFWYLVTCQSYQKHTAMYNRSPCTIILLSITFNLSAKNDLASIVINVSKAAWENSSAVKKVTFFFISQDFYTGNEGGGLFPDPRDILVVNKKFGFKICRIVKSKIIKLTQLPSYIEFILYQPINHLEQLCFLKGILNENIFSFYFFFLRVGHPALSSKIYNYVLHRVYSYVCNGMLRKNIVTIRKLKLFQTNRPFTNFAKSFSCAKN